MTMNDDIVFDLLSLLDNQKSVEVTTFVKRVRVFHKDNTRGIVDYLEKEHCYIEQKDNHYRLSSTGKTILKRIKYDKKIKRFNLKYQFLKNWYFILSYILLALYALYGLLKQIRIF